MTHPDRSKHTLAEAAAAQTMPATGSAAGPQPAPETATAGVIDPATDPAAVVQGAAALPPRDAMGLGILLMLGALALLTLMDATALHLTQTYPVAQIVWARFAINLAILAVVFKGRLRSLFRSQMPIVQASRGVMQMATVTLYFLALLTIPLAQADAIFDINPMMIVLGAALFLGEKIGPRRILAILVAFVGAMMIIRPGAVSFEAGSALALASAVTYTIGNLLTRAVRTDSLATSLIWGATIGTCLSSLILPFYWRPVQGLDMGWFLLLGVFGTLGQALVIRAFAICEAGRLAPFGYFGLIFAGTWGWLFFGQIPDRWTIAGALVISGAGLYVWYRERKSA